LLNKAYKVSIVYFLLFSLLLLASGLLIFADKIGFSYIDILHYYLGDINNFTSAKSFIGISKIVVPHIFAFGLFVMVLLHFLIFTKRRDTKEFQIIIYLCAISAFLEIFTAFLIIQGYTLFIYIKLFSFFIFYLCILYIIFILFKSIIYDK